MIDNNKLFCSILLNNNKNICPVYGRIIDIGDMAWNNGESDYGSPCSVIECQCQKCGTEIFHFSTWGEMENIDAVINEIELHFNSNK